MNSVLVVYDFDQTITRKHTFLHHGLMKEPSREEASSHYQSGKQSAPSNIKIGLGKTQFENSAGRLVSIATYHNNPDYIAGYLSCIFNSELVLKQRLISKRHEAIAINEYQISQHSALYRA